MDSISSLSQKGRKGGGGKREEEEEGANEVRAASADLQRGEGRERATASSREGEGLRKNALQPERGGQQQELTGRQQVQERKEQQPARQGKQQQQLLLQVQQEDHTGRVTKAGGRSEGREEEAGRRDGETVENTGMDRLRERGRSSSRSRVDGDEDGIEGRDDERRVSDRSGRSRRKGSGAGAIGVEVKMAAKQRGSSVGSASEVFGAEELAGAKFKGRKGGQRSLLSSGEEASHIDTLKYQSNGGHEQPQQHIEEQLHPGIDRARVAVVQAVPPPHMPIRPPHRRRIHIHVHPSHALHQPL
ncbi:unnamed protein product [Closterium sp. Naga37s-1]|nr:unnamed protein product [Closterium sp. Naga37s-1]